MVIRKFQVCRMCATLYEYVVPTGRQGYALITAAIDIAVQVLDTNDLRLPYSDIIAIVIIDLYSYIIAFHPPGFRLDS